MRNSLACAVRFVRAPPVNKLLIPFAIIAGKRSSPALWRLLWRPPSAQQNSDNDAKRNAYGQPLSTTFRPHRKPRNDQRCNTGVRLHGRTPRAFQTQKKAMMSAMCHRKKVRILELFRGHFGPLRTDCTHPTARSSSCEHYGSSRAQRPHSQRLNFSHKGVSTLNIELLNWCFDERYYDSANGRSISPLRDR